MNGLLKSRMGQLGSLQGIIITLVVIGIVLGIGFVVLNAFMTQLGADTVAFDAINSTIQAIKVIPTWLSIIVIIAIVGILLTIVFSVLPRGQTV